VHSISGFYDDPLDTISNFFYNPWTFWGVPLVLALLWESYRRLFGVPFKRRRASSATANGGEQSDRL
jgi:hypothetical protein